MRKLRIESFHKTTPRLSSFIGARRKMEVVIRRHMAIKEEAKQQHNWIWYRFRSFTRYHKMITFLTRGKDGHHYLHAEFFRKKQTIGNLADTKLSDWRTS